MTLPKLNAIISPELLCSSATVERRCNSWSLTKRESNVKKLVLIATIVTSLSGINASAQQVYTSTGPKPGDKGTCQPRLEVLEICKSVTSNLSGGFKVEPVGGTTRTLGLAPGESEVVDVTGGTGRMVKITEMSPGLVQVTVKKVELVNGQLVYTSFPFTNGTSLLSAANIGHSVEFVNQIVGTPGSPGPQGPAGPMGPQGPQGLPGKLPVLPTKFAINNFDVGFPLGTPTALTSVKENDGTYSQVMYFEHPPTGFEQHAALFPVAVLAQLDVAGYAKCIQVDMSFHLGMPFTMVQPAMNRAFAWYGNWPGGPWVYNWNQDLPDYRNNQPCLRQLDDAPPQ